MGNVELYVWDIYKPPVVLTDAEKNLGKKICKEAEHCKEADDLLEAERCGNCDIWENERTPENLCDQCKLVHTLTLYCQFVGQETDKKTLAWQGKMEAEYEFIDDVIGQLEIDLKFVKVRGKAITDTRAFIRKLKSRKNTITKQLLKSYEENHQHDKY